MRTTSEGPGSQVALGAWLPLVGAAFCKADPRGASGRAALSWESRGASGAAAQPSPRQARQALERSLGT